MKKKDSKWMFLPLCFAALTATAQEDSLSRDIAKSPANLTSLAKEVAAAQASLVRHSELFGDWFGLAGDDVPTSYIRYYYDANNRIVAKIQSSHHMGDSENTVEVEKKGDQIPEEYHYYTYDERGNLVSVDQRKYRIVKGVKRSWADFENVEHHSYDSENRLVHTWSKMDAVSEYSWDGDRLVERNDSTQRGNWIRTSVFSDFKEGLVNCPQTVMIAGNWNQHYKGVYTYDDLGRPTTYTTYKVTGELDETHHFISFEVNDLPYSQTVYSYDEQGLSEEVTSYWNKSANDYVPSNRTTYTNTEKGARRKMAYSYSDGKWIKFGTDREDFSANYDSRLAPQQLKSTLAKGKLNVTKLACRIPEAATADAKWKVFRNGVYVGDGIADQDSIRYEDVQLPNGHWQYYIQYATAADTAGVNVSNVVDVKYSPELKRPAGLRILKEYDGTAELEEGATKCHFAQIAWDGVEPTEPDTTAAGKDRVYPELLGFNVYSDLRYYMTNPTPLNETLLPADTREYTASWPAEDGDNKAHTFYVEAVYDCGYAMASPLALYVDAQSAVAVKMVETMGDAMGDMPDDVASLRTIIYYDQNGRIVREADLGRLMGDNYDTPTITEKEGDYQATYYRFYNYDENGFLIEKLQSRYYVHEGYAPSWDEPQTLVTYKNDTEGRCIEEVDDSRRTVRSWDGANLVKEEVYSTLTGAWVSTTVFQDFVEGKENLPQRAIKDGKYTSAQRVIEYKYDETGRPVEVLTGKFGEVERDNDGNLISATVGTPEYKETWEYETDSLVYRKEKWSTKKEAYEDNMRNVTTYGLYAETETHYKYDTWINKWTKSGMPVRTTRSKFFPVTAPTNFTVTVNENKVNAVKVKAVSVSDNWDSPTYNVYRNGMLVGQAKASGTSLSFEEENVPNGTWDYLLQANTNAQNVTVNVPTPITVKFDTELTPVTDIRVVQASKTEDRYYMTVAWDAPESSILLNGYNFYHDLKSYIKNPAPDNGVSPLTETEYSINWDISDGSEKTVYVEAVYNIGRKRSEGVKFDVSTILTAIDKVDAGQTSLTLENNQLRVVGNYRSLTVYNAAGQACASIASASSLDLNTLSSGVYVVRLVKENGQVETLKFAK